MPISKSFKNKKEFSPFKNSLKQDINLYDQGLTQEPDDVDVAGTSVPTQTIPTVSPGEDEKYGFVDQEVLDPFDRFEGFDPSQTMVSPMAEYDAYLDKADRNLKTIGLGQPMSDFVYVAARDAQLGQEFFSDIEKFARSALGAGIGASVFTFAANTTDWFDQMFKSGWDKGIHLIEDISGKELSPEKKENLEKARSAMFDMGVGAVVGPGTGAQQMVKDVYQSVTGVDLGRDIADDWRAIGVEMESWDDIIDEQYAKQYGGQFITKDEDGKIKVDYGQMANWDFWLTKVAEQLPNIAIFALTSFVGGPIASRAYLGLKGMPRLGAGIRALSKSQFGTKTKRWGQAIFGKQFSGQSIAAFHGAGIASTMSEGLMIASEAYHRAKTEEGINPELAALVGAQVWTDNMWYWWVNAFQYSVLTKGAGALGNAGKMVTGNGFKSVLPKAMTAAGLIYTEGKAEEFQEVYQEWRVKTRLAEMKGEEFMSYWDYFNDPEMAETRVVSFAAGAAMGGFGTTINMIAESQSIQDRAIEASGFTEGGSSLLFADAARRIAEMEEGESGFSREESAIAKQAKAIQSFVLSLVTEGQFHNMDEHLAREVKAGRITEQKAKEVKKLGEEMNEAFAPYQNASIQGMPPSFLREFGRMAYYISQAKKQKSNQIEALEEQRAQVENRDPKTKKGKAQQQSEIEIINREIAKTNQELDKDVAGYEAAMVQIREDALAHLESEVKKIDDKNKKKSEQTKIAKMKEEISRDEILARREERDAEITRLQREQRQREEEGKPSSKRITKKLLQKATNKAVAEYVFGGKTKAEIKKRLNEVIKQINDGKATIGGKKVKLTRAQQKEIKQMVEEMQVEQQIKEETEKFLKDQKNKKKPKKSETKEGINIISTKGNPYNRNFIQKKKIYKTQFLDGTPAVVEILYRTDGSREFYIRTADGDVVNTVKYDKDNTLTDEQLVEASLNDEVKPEFVEEITDVNKLYSKKQIERHGLKNVQKTKKPDIKEGVMPTITFGETSEVKGLYKVKVDGVEVQQRHFGVEEIFRQRLKKKGINLVVFDHFATSIQGRRYVGLAEGLTVFLDANSATQEAFYHELGHVYAMSQWNKPWMKALRKLVLGEKVFQAMKYKYAPALKIQKGKEVLYLMNLIQDGKIMTFEKWSEANERNPKAYSVYMIEEARKLGYEVMPDEEQRYIVEEAVVDLIAKAKDEQNLDNLINTKKKSRALRNIKKMFGFAKGEKTVADALEIFEKTGNTDLLNVNDVLAEVVKDYNSQVFGKKKGKFNMRLDREGMLGKSNINQYFSTEEFVEVTEFVHNLYEKLEQDSALNLDKYVQEDGTLEAAGKKALREHKIDMKDEVDSIVKEKVKKGEWSNEMAESYKERAVKYLRDSNNFSNIQYVKELEEETEFDFIEAVLETKNKESRVLSAFRKEFVSLQGKVQGKPIEEKDVTKALYQMIKTKKADGTLKTKEEFEQDVEELINRLNNKETLSPKEETLAKFIRHMKESYSKLGLKGFNPIHDLHHEISSMKRNEFYGYHFSQNKDGEVVISMSLSTRIRGEGKVAVDKEVEKSIKDRFTLTVEEKKEQESSKKAGRIKLLSQFYGLRSKLIAVDKENIKPSQKTQKKKNIVAGFIYDHLLPENVKQDISVQDLYDVKATEDIVSDNAFQLLKETSMFNFREIKTVGGKQRSSVRNQNSNNWAYYKKQIIKNIKSWKQYHKNLDIYTTEELNNIENLLMFSMENPSFSDNNPEASFGHMSFFIQQKKGDGVFGFSSDKGTFVSDIITYGVVREISRGIKAKHYENQYDSQIQYPSGENAALLVKQNQIDILQNQMDFMYENNPGELRRLFSGNRIIENWLDGKGPKPKVVPIIGTTIYETGKDRKGFDPGKTPPDRITVARVGLIAKAIIKGDKTYSQNITDFGDKNTEMHLLNAELISLEEAEAEAKRLGFTEEQIEKDIKETINLLQTFYTQRGKNKFPKSLFTILKNTGSEGLTQKEENLGYRQLKQIVLNHFINKHHAKDLFIGPEIYFGKDSKDIFTDYNKRASGAIASHIAFDKDIRVEPILVDDVVTDGINRTDASSFILPETAGLIQQKYGALRKVGKHYKFVYYGQNLDNTTFENQVGKRHPFYGKTNVFILTDEYVARHPNFKPLQKALRTRLNATSGSSVMPIIMFKSASKVNGVRAENGLDNKYISVDELAGMSETELNNHQNSLFQYEVENEKGETEFKYGLDGSYFGVQTELDKKSRESTIAKQLVLGILANVNQKQDAEAVIGALVDFFGEKNENFFRQVIIGDKSNIATKLNSISELISKSVEEEVYGPGVREMIEEGGLDSGTLNVTRDILLSQIKKKGLSMRAPGGIGHQSTDFAIGEVVEKISTSSGLNGGYMVGEKGNVQIEVSEDFAKKHGYKIGDIVISQRIPYSVGDAFVSEIVGFNKGQGSMVTIPSTVSDIIGSDLDGDNLHIFGKYVKNLNDSKNKFNSAFDMMVEFLTSSGFERYARYNINAFGDIITGLETKNAIKETQVIDDRTIMGAHLTYRKTKEAEALIGISATFNNLQKILSAYNVSTTIGTEINGLNNSYTDTNGTATENLALMLNAFLDNLNKGYATRLNMNLATFPIWSELLSRGFSFEKAAKVMTSDDFVLYAEMKERFPYAEEYMILQRIYREKENIIDKEKINEDKFKLWLLKNEMANVVNSLDDVALKSTMEVLKQIVNFDNYIPQTYIEAQDLINRILQYSTSGDVNLSGLISVNENIDTETLLQEMWMGNPNSILREIQFKNPLVQRNFEKLVEIAGTLKRIDPAYTGGYNVLLNRLVPFNKKKRTKFKTTKDYKNLENKIRAIRLSQSGIYNYSTLWTSLNNLLGEDVFNKINDEQIPLEKRFDIVLGYINEMKSGTDFAFINKYFVITEKDKYSGYAVKKGNKEIGFKVTEDGVVFSNVSVKTDIKEYTIKPNKRAIEAVSSQSLKNDFAKLPKAIQDFLFIYDLERNSHTGPNKLLPFLQGETKTNIAKETKRQVVNSAKDLEKGHLSRGHINSVKDIIALSNRGVYKNLTNNLFEENGGFAEGVRLAKDGSGIVVNTNEYGGKIYGNTIYSMDINSSNGENMTVLFRSEQQENKRDFILTPMPESVLRGEDQFLSNMVEEETRDKRKNPPTLYMFEDDKVVGHSNNNNQTVVDNDGVFGSPDMYMLVDDEQYFRKKDVLDYADYLNMREGRVVDFNRMSNDDKMQADMEYKKYKEDLKEVKRITNKYLKKDPFGQTPLETQNKYKGKKGVEFIRNLLEEEVNHLDKVAKQRLYNTLVKIISAKQAILSIDKVLERNKDLAPGTIEELKTIQARIRKGDKSFSDVTAGDMWGNPDLTDNDKRDISEMLLEIEKSEMHYRRELNKVKRVIQKSFDNLLKEKFKDKAGPLWWILYGMYKGLPSVQHMKMFNRHLFANVAEEVEGYNAETGKFYRFLRLRNFLDSNGKISEAKMKNAGLTKAEQDYYRMYHGMTTMFHDHMSTKKGADNQVLLEKEQTLYIPNRKGSKMEFVIARNLAATFISFNYDGKLKLINVKGVNPLTGKEEVHQLKDFINFYMIAQSPEAIKQYEQEMGIKTPKVPSDRKMKTELKSLQRQAKDHLKTGMDAAGKKAIIAEEMESLTDAQPFNRHTHSRSAKAGYQASWDINHSLNLYVSENLFMHGLETQKGFSYRGAMHLQPLIDGVIAHSAFKGQKNLQRWAQELWKEKYLLKQPKKSFIGKDGKKHYVDRVFELLQMWTMVVGLALKPAVAVMNVSIGKINEYRRAGFWNFAKGERRFWGLQNKFEGSRKTQSIAWHFNLLHDPAEQVTDSLFGGWFGKFLFSPMVLSENYIQKAAFAGQLTDAEWDSFSIDEDGYIVVKEGMNSVEKGKSNEEVFAELTENAAEYKSNVYEVQGRGYTVTDQRLMQNYFILDGVLQFKRWFPTYAVDRLGGDRINRYGEQKIGTLRALFSKELVDAIREGGLPKEILAKLPKHKAEAINRALRGGYALTFLFLLIAMAGGMSDDDEDSGMINSMWSLTGDIMLLMNISKLRHMITPPMITTGENMLSGIQYGVSGATYQRDTKYFDKGDSKAKGAFIKALPMFARKPFVRKDN